MDKTQAKQKFNCNESLPVLAILGGSQGSVPLNRHFQKECKKYTQSGIQILWQCGKADYPKLKGLNNIVPNPNGYHCGPKKKW